MSITRPSLYAHFAILTLAMSVPSIACADPAPSTPGPTSILIKPDRVFAPVHFDDNDNAQFIFESSLISSCEKAGLSSAQVDQNSFTITLEAHQYAYSGCWCIPVESSYSSVISLGLLAAGRYTIQARLVDGSLARIGELPIVHAQTASPDDYLYAPVESMHLDPAAPPSRPVLVLNGRFGNGCSRITRVKVNRLPNLIEVLPITEVSAGTCMSVPAPFTQNVNLGAVTPGERLLIHVRSLNGQALNQVQQF